MSDRTAYNHAYYQAHRDPRIVDRVPMTGEERAARKRERDRVYTTANRERLCSYQRARYLREREQRAVLDRQRRLADPEAARERSRRWRLAHPDRMRQHRRQWLDDVPIREAAARCAMTANRRARMYGADGQIGYETLIDLWAREPVCVDCGDGRGLDHVIPLSRGGSNTSGNLANRCRSCNSRKGTRILAELGIAEAQA